MAPPPSSRALTYQTILNEVQDYIDEHGVSNPDINIHGFCDSVNRSVRTVQRALEYNGTSWALELIDWRVDQGKHFLAHTELPVHEVAEKCGFRTASRFGEVFKKSTGMTATDYRKQQHAPE